MNQNATRLNVIQGQMHRRLQELRGFGPYHPLAEGARREAAHLESWAMQLREIELQLRGIAKLI